MRKHLCLFSGPGIPSLVFESCGFETVAFSEINPYCCEILVQHWPDVPNLGSVKEIRGEDVKERFGPIDVVSGGFPCTSISAAGKGQGLGTPDSPTDSGLWFEMHRVVQEVRPRWALIENSPRLRTLGADTILDDLEESGYQSWATVVGARHLQAPHKRDRVWIVAARRDVADTLGDALRQLEQRGPEARGSDTLGVDRETPQNGWKAFSGGDGAGVGLANALLPRLEGRADPSPREGTHSGAGQFTHDGSEVLADSNDRGRESIGVRDETGRQCEQASQWTHPDRCSGQGLDQAWVARPGECQFDWEPPRIDQGSREVPGKTQPRLGRGSNGNSNWTYAQAQAERLKAIGNAWVPQVAEVFARQISRLDDLARAQSQADSPTS